VGVEAARLAGVARVYESTMNRDELLRGMAEHAPELLEDEDAAIDDSFGSPADVITHAVDVRSFLDRKRAAMAAHASQISAESFFLSMAPVAFEMAFGTEWYIERG